MDTPTGNSPHWMLDRVGERGLARVRLDNWTRWGFVLFAGCALVYGLGGLYASGSRLESADLSAVAAAGSDAPVATSLSVPLEPGMNPLRAVLHSTHAPVGSRRWKFELQLVDERGHVVLTKQTFLGSVHDEASVVLTRTDLGSFEVAQAGQIEVRLRTIGSTTDDVREVKLELRRNVMRLDARLLWGLGLAAVACLIANLVLSSRALPLDARQGEQPRRAA